jgi:hypothetical protein
MINDDNRGKTNKQNFGETEFKGFDKPEEGKEINGLSDMETQEYYAIPQNDAIVKICEGIMKLKNAVIDRFIGNRMNVKLGKNGEDIINFETDYEVIDGVEDFKINSLDRAKDDIRTSQIQLFQFILCQFNKQRCNVIKLDIADYFHIRGIKRRKENMDRFIEDLSILAHINLDLGASNFGKKDRVIGKLLTVKGKVYAGAEEITKESFFNKKLKYIVIELGNWINNIKLNQYIYVPKDFFKYNSKTEWVAVMLSIKIGQLIRVNKSKIIKNGCWTYSIEYLMQYLSISEQELNKQGFRHYQGILQNAFKVLEKEGYSIKFSSNYNCIDDFKKGSIVYSNELLISKYKEIKSIKKKTKG